MPLCFQSRPTLVAYVTCGDPDLATTREIVLAAVEAGAGVIELGVPFSDPLADGPVIQRAGLAGRDNTGTGSHPGARDSASLAGRAHHLFLFESDFADGADAFL